MNTLDKFKDILTELVGVDAGDIEESSNLAADLGADSLDIVEIQMACEGEFGIEISDEEIERLNTVADWVELIERGESQ